MVANMIGRGHGTIPAMVLVVLAVLATGTARADLTCSAQVDRRQVAAGGQVILTLSAESDQQQQPQHDAPVIAGVDVVPGGTSQSYRLSGGRTEMSVTATYYLQVRRQGDFRIPPVAFTAGGLTCATEPITVSVAGAPPPTQTGNRGPAPRSTTPAGETGRGDSGPRSGQPGDTSFITLTVDRDEVWVGQQIQLIFRYHRRRSSWDQPKYIAPRTEGFWRLDLPPERNYRRNIQGQVYDITELRYALFPTRAGDLVVESARLTLPGDPFERFFGRRGRAPRNLETDPIPILVKDLPLPRPSRFSGIVASRLDFTVTVDRDTVPRGEPVALTLEVAADGFLKSFSGLELTEPEGLRVHDAAENLREDVTGPRYAAVFRQEKAVVPTREGTVNLPPLELVYFDTGRGQYVTRSATAPPLVVTPSDLPVAGDDPSGFRRTEIERLGRDLAFVRGETGALRHGRPVLPRLPLWWAMLVAPWGLLGLYRLRLLRLDAHRRDPAGRRRQTAWNRAQRQLARLGRDGEAADLARVLTEYVADHTGRAAAGLTAAEVRIWAESLDAAEAGERLSAILSRCDQARFGGTAAVDVGSLAGEARELLAVLEKRSGRRLGSGARATRVLLLTLAVTIPAAAQDLPPAMDAAPGVDPARLMAEGNQAYTDGDLDLAVRRYRSALALGADDATLHYNLGNAHARAGELGRAIASYLRSQRLAPCDGDTRTNLAWVRSHTRDLELTGGGLPPVIAQLDAAAHILSLDEWATLLVVFCWLAAGLVAWRWYRGWLAVGLRRILLLAGGLLLAVAVVTATRWYEEQLRDTAVVIVEEVEVRGGPATTFPVVFRIHDGLTLVIRGEREGWVRIGLGGDWVGWVPAGTLESVRRSLQ